MPSLWQRNVKYILTLCIILSLFCQSSYWNNGSTCSQFSWKLPLLQNHPYLTGLFNFSLRHSRLLKEETLHWHTSKTLPKQSVTAERNWKMSFKTKSKWRQQQIPIFSPEARCNKFLYLYTRSAAPIDFSLPKPEHIQIEEMRGKIFAQRGSSQLG